MEILEQLKIIINDTVKAMDLLSTGYATVIRTSPLTLKILATQMEVIEPVAELTDNVRYKAVIVQGETVVINPGLRAGDKVLVMKANSGQNYIVISKA